jgi:hypothetical protein
MKYFTLWLVYASLFTFTAWAQVPQQMNYQGIARDVKGNPLVRAELQLRIGITAFPDAHEFIYQETHSCRTNEFGLYQLRIGDGIPCLGKFTQIPWSNGNLYIHVDIKPSPSADFLSVATTSLLSVPYAFYAASSGELSPTTKTRAASNFIEKTNSSGVVNSSSQLFDNGNSIGLGTSAPASGSKLHILSNASNSELLRLQNNNANAYGRFTMYNNTSTSYATFTKYGSAVTGGYSGVPLLYPYANLLAFGNNNGGFLLSNSGNIGLSIYKAGISKLKFHVDYASENIGIGGNAVPVANVHINQASNGDTILVTNNLSGHSANDGLKIQLTGLEASIVNQEQNALNFGTNNLIHLHMNAAGLIGIGTFQPEATLHIAGQTDTSLYVTSNSANGLYNGIIRAEYTGNTIDNHVAIFGRSMPDVSVNNGIGLSGEGGYIGVQAMAKCSSPFSVYGSLSEANSRGETFGSYSSAQSDTAGNLGMKYGVYGIAGGGQFNYGVYGAVDNAGASLNSYAGFFNGKVNINGTLNVLGSITKGGGTFKIDHPLDPENKYLYHSFVESPDMMNIYNGNCTTDQQGRVVIQLPDYFEALNKDFRYQLTCIGQPAQIWISEKIQSNQFTIQSDKPEVEISWQVTGIRNDAYANAHRVVAEVEKETENKGTYLYPAEAGVDDSKNASPKAPSFKTFRK